MIKNLKILYKMYKLAIHYAIIVFVFGVIYYIWLKITGIGIPCIIRTVTGLKCPGCGITHFFIDIAKFDFKGAFYDNAAIAFLLPIWIIYFFAMFIRKLINPYSNFIFIKFIEIFTLTILIVFGIVRNIPVFKSLF